MSHTTNNNLFTRIAYRALADLIFYFHLMLVLLVLFGWALPKLWLLYMFVLEMTLLSDIFFGYCILSKWEFYLRKKIDETVAYSYTWTTYYTYKYTQHTISEKFFERASLIFLLVSIVINLYFHYFF